MYTINKTKGIGEVIEVANGNVTVYFPDTDETKKLLEAFTRIYTTYDEAYAALYPEMTAEIANEVVAEIEAEKQIMANGTKAQHHLEAYHIEQSKKLFKNI